MKMNYIKPVVLVTSDVHLGSLDCEIDLFIQFLREIIDGEFGRDLQALIILGDFIDLCMDVPQTLLKRKKIQEIFTLLLRIKYLTNLIFVIGNHEIPVIAMTAHAMKEDRQRCLDIGMDDYTSKPIDPKELLEKIQQWTNVDNAVCI